jgi:hypothetical protein
MLVGVCQNGTALALSILGSLMPTLLDDCGICGCGTD